MTSFVFTISCFILKSIRHVLLSINALFSMLNVTLQCNIYRRCQNYRIKLNNKFVMFTSIAPWLGGVGCSMTSSDALLSSHPQGCSWSGRSETKQIYLSYPGKQIKGFTELVWWI